MIGIYKITYKKDNRCYIGQSINLEHRLKEHRNCEGDSYIHRAIKKYGLDNFSFEIIEICEKERLDFREIYWINYYDSFNHGFNLTPGGSSTGNEIAVDCFNFSGDRICTYPSISAAEEDLGIMGISRCVHGIRKECGGYQWKIHDDRNEFIDKYSRTVYNSKGVSQYDLNEYWIADFNSISEAARNVFYTDNGSLRKRIKKACEENMGCADGYLWSYYHKSEIAQLADLLD